MKRRVSALALVLALGAAGATAAEANEATLRGSRAQMELQNRVAKEHDLSFYRTRADIESAVAAGELVELPGNADYEVADFVSYPYAHTSVRVFVERLSSAYRSACDQKLVVTSLVRPTSGQPRNAHALSVHPAGMAVDLRVSDREACRAWLEAELLGLEREGLINGIREYHPPHYHVAIYPEQYLAYAAERQAEEDAAAAVAAAARAELAAQAAAATPPLLPLDGAGRAGRGAPALASAAVLALLLAGAARTYRR